MGAARSSCPCQSGPRKCSTATYFSAHHDTIHIHCFPIACTKLSFKFTPSQTSSPRNRNHKRFTYVRTNISSHLFNLQSQICHRIPINVLPQSMSNASNTLDVPDLPSPVPINDCTIEADARVITHPSIRSGEGSSTRSISISPADSVSISPAQSISVSPVIRHSPHPADDLEDPYTDDNDPFILDSTGSDQGDDIMSPDLDEIGSRGDQYGHLTPPSDTTPATVHPIPDDPQPPAPILPSKSPLDIYNSSDTNNFFRVILTLVAFLHNRYHLSFRGCGLLLYALGSIFTLAGLVPVNTKPLPKNLTTVLNRLDLHDRFTTHPICQHCHHIFAHDITPDVNLRCPTCDTKIFSAAPTTLERITRQPSLPKPECVAPIQSLSSTLPSFLQCGSNEKSCESWRSSEPQQHWQKKTEIWHGDIWNTVKGPDGEQWFDRNDDPAVLKLGVTLSLDW